MDVMLSAKGKTRRVVAMVSSFGSLAEIILKAPLIASVPHPIAYRMTQTHGLSVGEFNFKVPLIVIKLVRTRARGRQVAELADAHDH